MAVLRRRFAAPLVLVALLAAPHTALAAPDPTADPSPSPGATTLPRLAQESLPAPGSADEKPNPNPGDGPTGSVGGQTSQEPLEAIGNGNKGKEPTAQQRQQALADQVAVQKAQEAARQAVAEARTAYESALARHRLNRAKIVRLKRESAQAARRAAGARRDMGNMARLAYSSGDADLNLVAALLDSRSPQEVLSGAGTAARIASHKETEWTRALQLQAEADELSAEAKSLAGKSAAALAQAKQAVADAMDVADSVDLAIAPPTKVPPVDLTTKSDWVFPTATGIINSEAGMRMHPILGYVRCHAGADISAPSGTPIYAVDDGVVLTAGVNGGYGNYTLIAHGKGLTSAYAHQQLILVKAGDRVTRGQLIGEVGTTGLSTGAHLHFEASYHGVPYDPRGWLEDRPERRVPAC